jgi:hypothetical protein
MLSSDIGVEPSKWIVKCANVPSWPSTRLENSDVVPASDEFVGTRETGNASTDHDHALFRTSALARRATCYYGRAELQEIAAI